MPIPDTIHQFMTQCSPISVKQQHTPMDANPAYRLNRIPTWCRAMDVGGGGQRRF